MKKRRFAVLGDPIAHSKSPRMHQAFYAERGLPHGYEAHRVASEELGAWVERLRQGEFDGFNITVPHKERVLAFVDACEGAVQALGAANTLVRDSGGKIVAYNTDAPALAMELRRLRQLLPPPPSSRRVERVQPAWAVVLGSGGAARAAVVALGADLGVERIVVRARWSGGDAQRALFLGDMQKALRQAGSSTQLEGSGLEAMASVDAAATFVVQATRAGMVGADEGSPVAAAVAWDVVSPIAVALDVVYAPRETPFLKAARQRGLVADDGLGMLAAQGALAAQLWLGGDAPFSIMRRALEET